MIKIREPRPTGQPSVSRETQKRWTTDDTATVDEVCRTGRLPDPDNRIATQERLALFLGFSRQWIAKRLAGRKLPLCTKLMSEGGMKSAERRARARAEAIRQHRAIRLPD